MASIVVSQEDNYKGLIKYFAKVNGISLTEEEVNSIGTDKDGNQKCTPLNDGVFIPNLSKLPKKLRDIIIGPEGSVSTSFKNILLKAKSNMGHFNKTDEGEVLNNIPEDFYLREAMINACNEEIVKNGRFFGINGKGPMSHHMKSAEYTSFWGFPGFLAPSLKPEAASETSDEYVLLEDTQGVQGHLEQIMISTFGALITLATSEKNKAQISLADLSAFKNVLYKVTGLSFRKKHNNAKDGMRSKATNVIFGNNPLSLSLESKKQKKKTSNRTAEISYGTDNPDLVVVQPDIGNFMKTVLENMERSQKLVSTLTDKSLRQIRVNGHGTRAEMDKLLKKYPSSMLIPLKRWTSVCLPNTPVSPATTKLGQSMSQYFNSRVERIVEIIDVLFVFIKQSQVYTKNIGSLPSLTRTVAEEVRAILTELSANSSITTWDIKYAFKEYLTTFEFMEFKVLLNHYASVIPDGHGFSYTIRELFTLVFDEPTPQFCKYIKMPDPSEESDELFSRIMKNESRIWATRLISYLKEMAKNTGMKTLPGVELMMPMKINDEFLQFIEAMESSKAQYTDQEELALELCSNEMHTEGVIMSSIKESLRRQKKQKELDDVVRTIPKSGILPGDPTPLLEVINEISGGLNRGSVLSCIQMNHTTIKDLGRNLFTLSYKLQETNPLLKCTDAMKDIHIMLRRYYETSEPEEKIRLPFILSIMISSQLLSNLTEGASDDDDIIHEVIGLLYLVLGSPDNESVLNIIHAHCLEYLKEKNLLSNTGDSKTLRSYKSIIQKIISGFENKWMKKM